MKAARKIADNKKLEAGWEHSNAPCTRRCSTANTSFGTGETGLREGLSLSRGPGSALPAPDGALHLLQSPLDLT